MKKYLFQSQRLGFRTWTDEDIISMHQLNANPNVMHFFPSIKNKEETQSFITSDEKATNEIHQYFKTPCL